jgi:hypothetical protein
VQSKTNCFFKFIFNEFFLKLFQFTFLFGFSFISSKRENIEALKEKKKVFLESTG